MRKQIIRLTENDLHAIINEAVNEALNELSFMDRARMCGYMSNDDIAELEQAVDAKHRKEAWEDYENRPKPSQEYIKTYDVN